MHRREGYLVLEEIKDFGQTIKKNISGTNIYTIPLYSALCYRKDKAVPIWFKMQLHVQRNTCNHLVFDVALVC